MAVSVVLEKRSFASEFGLSRRPGAQERGFLRKVCHLQAIEKSVCFASTGVNALATMFPIVDQPPGTSSG